MSKRRWKPAAVLLSAVFLLCPAARGGSGEKHSAPTAGGYAVVWSPYATWKGRQVNLGPTGARGWVDENRIYVAEVAKGSPAEGILRRGDAILGIAGAPFRDGRDPRIALGNAITDCETAENGGKLMLLVRRGGHERKVRLPLRVLGSYSPTWPFECAKSAKILDRSCAYVAAAQYPDGHLQGELGMATAWAGLLFLASGEARYLDNARRAAYWLTKQSLEGVVLNSWPCGYSALFLAEYYLATGDRAVLPALRALTRLMAKGQMKCGSWGHSIPWGGYGAVNQVGLSCFIALILAGECGIGTGEAAVRRSAAFFARYAGKGWVPYGDHKPWRGRGGNGKNALAAVAFQLLGADPAAVRHFSRSVAAGYRFREEGHTGSYFSFFWGPLAAIHAGREEFRTFLDNQKWYYDLARTHDGGLVCQPNAENLGGRTPGTYTWCGPAYTSGGMALFYALPRKRLRILGASRSVFGRTLPARLSKARSLYEQRKWDELRACLAQAAKARNLPAEQKRLADQLAAAAALQRQSVNLTVRAVESHVREGDVYRASELLKSLERLCGKDDPKLSPARELMAKNERWVETGRKYYEAWSALRDFTWQYWHYYGRRATGALEQVVPPVPRQWESIVATSEKTPQRWRVFQWGSRGAEPPEPDLTWNKLKGWQREGFDDSKWASAPAPLAEPRRGAPGWDTAQILLRRTFRLDDPVWARLRVKLSSGRTLLTEVYLNGTKVLEAVPGPRRGYAAIELPPAAATLLKKGTNLLAVHCRKRKPGGASLDVGIEAAKE
jgi:hypothetical protein